jgi:ABC-type glycerol-3-phosphate transport system substrate-binding protein
MKKALSLLLALTMALALTACGGTETADTQEAETENRRTPPRRWSCMSLRRPP